MTAKKIHFIRHAQSCHNARAATVEDEDIVRRDPALRDARLTAAGQDQAKTLAVETAGLRDIELVVVSPLTRAIQTTMAAFVAHPAPRLIEALHREKQESYCDIGRAPQELAQEFPDFGFDHLDDPWWFDGPLDGAPYPRETQTAFEQRVARFADWLSARPEHCLAVIGHGTFLRHLTGAIFANAQRIEMTF
ncbi:MAG: histidine phosphatase family protein [Paracoccus sp. (in: a-proteobacteria)]|nr:histidine phosphatase family protein [Paracoccus sp. (in: a-proteobacteria)]